MRTLVIGDLHGHYQEYEQLLQTAGLCDGDLNWTGGDDHLWLMGDFFDRGESGIRCLDVTMKIQAQAADAGGLVQSILGNHELMILCAFRFSEGASEVSSEPVYQQWLRWGGIEADFSGLTEAHATWIENLPAMALVKDSLLIHADAMLYVEHGFNIDSVNRSFYQLMQGRDFLEWERTLSAFSEHQTFSSLEITGKQRADQLLSLYGGNQIVHGHTPIPWARKIDAATVTDAWRYAGDRCINVDGGIYMGSPGFVYEL